MIITFSHIVDGHRVPLLDEQEREVTLSVSANDRTSAINSQDVKDFIAGQNGYTDIRVRRVE